jgi:hypothetical protein
MRRRVVAVVLAMILLPSTFAGLSLAHDPDADRDTADGAQGLVLRGLTPAREHGPCRGMGYETRIAPGLIGCTHGPDPAPEGIDVRVERSLESLRADVSALQQPTLGTLSDEPGSVPCIGDGTSGRRLVAVYAYPGGGLNRYAEVAPLIRAWAREADEVVRLSAAATGGVRHLRWAHDPECRPMVRQVALDEASVSGFGWMAQQLYEEGYSRTDRRYVVWVDASVYCGVAHMAPDDRRSQGNLNNGVAAAGFGFFARIDAPCWGLTEPKALVEAHEIMHTLGGVQASAPHATAFGHCIDEHETMCYRDDPGTQLIYVCPPTNERRFDCGHNDYFHTAPGPTNYLATHWNTADSAFLVRATPFGGFLDVAGSTFRLDIAWIAGAGITKGCTPDRERYCPNDFVTRGQMASFLVRALGLPKSSTDYFTDDNGTTHEADINALRAAGITSGCNPPANTLYCPHDFVTRGQMASFLARALGLQATSTDYFTDDNGTTHEADINKIAAAGITTTGCGGGKFCPKDFVTRGQMAAFLRRALGS